MPCLCRPELGAQQDLTWIVLCACRAGDGRTEGAPGPGPLHQEESSPEEAVTGEEEPSKALGGLLAS